MAFGVPIPGLYQPTLPQVDWLAISGKPIEPGHKAPAGTLMISDTFEPSLGVPHGATVRRAAVEQGFQGPVYVHSAPSDQRLTQSGDNIRALYEKKSPRETLGLVDSYAENFSVGLLNMETAAVNRANSTGSTQSVLNLSQGSSKASIAQHLYKQAAGEFSSPFLAMPGMTMPSPVVDNYAAAFGLDRSKLMSQDPKVSGPERAKLQQALIDRVSKKVDGSGQIKSAQGQFLQSVRNFESRHNSVVIAAGNEGQIAAELQKDNGGHKLRLPRDFDVNVLENSEVTSVGATRWYRNGSDLKEVPANYSTKSSGIDIWASGSVADAPFPGSRQSQNASTFGTSFAAPRVSAAMAQLHKDNPTMSSAQIENLMKSKLTHQLPTRQGDLPVLDYGATADYLAGHKF